MRADSTSLRDVVAKNVRLIRNNIGISQERLADIAGLHRTYIGAVERAQTNVSVDNLEKIAIALQVEAVKLFEGWRP